MKTCDTFWGLNYFLWLIISIPLYSVGEYCSKMFGTTHRWEYVFVGTLGYAIGSLCWFPAIFLRNELLVVDTMWKTLAAIATATLALFVFHERPTIVQCVGVVIVFIGMLMVK